MKPYYQDSAVTIYHGDCREILPTLGKFDLLLTDPPYGINAARHRNCQANGWRDYGTAEQGKWDEAPVDVSLLSLCLEVAKVSQIWGGNYFVLPPSMGWLVWDKGQRDFSLADCELCWTSQNKATRIYTMARGTFLQESRFHPTQKPVDLFSWCIGKAGDVKTVIDPFSGVGTTGRAAKDLGLKATLIEREESYCEIAAKRMSQEVLAL